MNQNSPDTPGPVATDAPVIYFSSSSGNTARYVAKAAEAGGFATVRLPLTRLDAPVAPTAPFVLVTPTYGGGEGRGAVPKQVIRFLNRLKAAGRMGLLAGVVSCGNTNFGTGYCLAGDIIAAKCGVPHLHRTEIFGTPEDVEALTRAAAALPVPAGTAG